MQRNVSTLVGVLGTDRFNWIEIQDELYYFTHVDIEGYVIPVVMSQFFFDRYSGMRIKFMAFPRKSRKKYQGVRKAFSYMYCVHVTAVGPDEDIPDCRYVELNGVVNGKMGELTLGIRNDSRILFELGFSVDFLQTIQVAAPCRAFGKIARAISTVEGGTPIKICGYVSGGLHGLRIVVKSFEQIALEQVI